MITKEQLAEWREHGWDSHVIAQNTIKQCCDEIERLQAELAALRQFCEGLPHVNTRKPPYKCVGNCSACAYAKFVREQSK